MASFNFQFDSVSFMDDLKKDILEIVEDEVANSSESILDDYIGEKISVRCSCGGTEAEVLPGGKVRCLNCNTVTVPQFEIDWE